MTFRQLLLMIACLLNPAAWGSADGASAENQKPLNWRHREIKFSAPPSHFRAAVATGIAIRKGTGEIAVAGDDHLVRILKRTTGKLVRVMAGHTDWIKVVTYHPDGKTLFTAGSDQTIIAWNADDESDFYRFAAEDRAITGMALDSQGKYLATVGFNDRVNLYDIASRKRVLTVAAPSADMRTIAFSPDDRLIAVAGRQGKIRVIDVNQGSTLCDISCHDKRIRDLVFASQDEIITCSEDKTVRLSRVSSQASKLLIRKDTKFYSLANLGGSTIAVGGSDNLIRILDLAGKTETGFLQGHKGTICGLVADGQELVSGSFDTQIRIWEIDKAFGKPIVTTNNSSRVQLSNSGFQIAK